MLWKLGSYGLEFSKAFQYLYGVSWEDAKPIIEEISDEMSNKLNFFYMDIDSSPSTPTLFGIRGVPTLILFDKNGEVKGTKVGNTNKANVEEFINSNI